MTWERPSDGERFEVRRAYALPRRRETLYDAETGERVVGHAWVSRTRLHAASARGELIEVDVLLIGPERDEALAAMRGAA
jgi:hypothetical protein